MIAPMITLLIGLVLFLGTHSVRIVADDWRTGVRAKLGENAWKGAYSIVSLVGFVLICVGFGHARLEPTVLWASPTWTRHLAALLTLPAFVLIAAAQVPGNTIKATVKHPMVLGVKVWALAHLLANNTLAELILFGAFLVWSVFDYRSSRQRDRAAGTAYPPGRVGPTGVAVIAGLVAWAVFAFWAHAALIGVRPFG
jgi:uncharacterized membrane protein